MGKFLEEKYKVIRTGGSLGDKPDDNIYDTKEEAQEAGKHWVKSFGTSKSYYKPGYRVQKVKEGNADFGYNARTDSYENLMAAGVIDPAKVTRVALENAASIAGMFLTTECVIADKKEENAPAAPAAMPGMGGMGGMMSKPVLKA